VATCSRCASFRLQAFWLRLLSRNSFALQLFLLGLLSSKALAVRLLALDLLARLLFPLALFAVSSFVRHPSLLGALYCFQPLARIRYKRTGRVSFEKSSELRSILRGSNLRPACTSRSDLETRFNNLFYQRG
jgi:hypothetical protein